MAGEAGRDSSSWIISAPAALSPERVENNLPVGKTFFPLRGICRSRLRRDAAWSIAEPNVNLWLVDRPFRYKPGDRVTMTVRDKSGQPRDLSYQLPLRGH